MLSLAVFYTKMHIKFSIAELFLTVYLDSNLKQLKKNPKIERVVVENKWKIILSQTYYITPFLF